MSDQSFAYIRRKAGDPWTVEDFHDVQRLIKDDIQGSIDKAIHALNRVDASGDADKFGGKTPEQFAKELVDRVMSELPKRTGYQMLFKVLKSDKESVIEHKLGAFPLTDIYQLEYFRVVASEDGHVFETFTTFYIYHSSESRIRFRPEETPTTPAVSMEIDPADGHVYRIPFKRMLDLYHVDYGDDKALGDVETDFWKAFLASPNDAFDDDQYCHSPWLDRNCREEHTVYYLKDRGEWDDIWFQVRPRKTINYNMTEGDLPWAPNNLEVVHFDLYTLGLTLRGTPNLPGSQTDPKPLDKNGTFPTPDAIRSDELKVMVLLKV